MRDPNVVYLQYGLIYKEIQIEDWGTSGLSTYGSFRNEGIGFNIDPFINSSDLRNPQNATILHEIFAYFGLDADKSYYENYCDYLREKQ